MYCERMNTDLPLRASYMPPWLLFPLPSQHQHGQHLDHLIFRLIIISFENIYSLCAQGKTCIHWILGMRIYPQVTFRLSIVLHIAVLGWFFPRKFHLSRLQGQDKVRGGDRAEEISDQTCRTCLTMCCMESTILSDCAYYNVSVFNFHEGFHDYCTLHFEHCTTLVTCLQMWDQYLVTIPILNSNFTSASCVITSGPVQYWIFLFQTPNFPNKLLTCTALTSLI